MKLALFSLMLFAFPAFAGGINMSVESLVSFVVYIVIIGLVFWLLWWLLSYCALPEPFAKIARVIIALIAVILVINILLGFAGHPIVNWR